VNWTFWDDDLPTYADHSKTRIVTDPYSSWYSWSYQMYKYGEKSSWLSYHYQIQDNV
jgi:hypothetical protein